MMADFFSELAGGFERGSYIGNQAADRRQARKLGAEHAAAELALLREQITGQTLRNAQAQEDSGLAMPPTAVRQHTLQTPDFGSPRGQFVRKMGDALSQGFGTMQAPPGMGGPDPLGAPAIPAARGLPPLTGMPVRVGPDAGTQKELDQFGLQQAIADELQGRTPGTDRRSALLAASGNLPLATPPKAAFDPRTDPEVQRRQYEHDHGLLWEPNQTPAGEKPPNEATWVANAATSIMREQDANGDQAFPTYEAAQAEAKRRYRINFDPTYQAPPPPPPSFMDRFRDATMRPIPPVAGAAPRGQPGPVVNHPPAGSPPATQELKAIRWEELRKQNPRLTADQITAQVNRELP